MLRRRRAPLQAQFSQFSAFLPELSPEFVREFTPEFARKLRQAAGL
jgi:hypothetical protein